MDLPNGEGIAAFLATGWCIAGHDQVPLSSDSSSGDLANPRHAAHAGAKAISLKGALLQLQHSVTAMNSGTIPVPRSSKVRCHTTP